MAIAIILGTRPEIIKMASVIRRPYRKLGMKVLDVATNVAGGVSFTDSQSGFRAYGRRAIESIYIKGSDMSAGSEGLLQAKDHDLRIKEVPIHCSYDVERASTQNPVSHGVKTLLTLLHDMELRRPLYYFTGPGMVMAAVGILMGLHFLQVFYHGGSLHGADGHNTAQHIQNDERM